MTLECANLPLIIFCLIGCVILLINAFLTNKEADQIKNRLALIERHNVNERSNRTLEEIRDTGTYWWPMHEITNSRIGAELIFEPKNTKVFTGVVLKAIWDQNIGMRDKRLVEVVVNLFHHHFYQNDPHYIEKTYCVRGDGHCDRYPHTHLLRWRYK